MIVRDHRRSFLLAVLALTAALAAAVLAMSMGVQDAKSAAYRSCSLSERDQDPPGETPTYNLSLKQQRTSCATAKKVMKAFHKCRGRTSYVCGTKVLSRWRCTGRRDSSTELMFYGRFTCKWNARRVTSSYQQNT